MKRTVVLSLLAVLLVMSTAGPPSRARTPETDSDRAEPVAWLARPGTALPPIEGWMPIRAGETQWYALDYQGHREAGEGKGKGETVWIGSQIHVLLDAEPDLGAAFSIWTPEQARIWALGEEVEPVGRGTKNRFEPGDLFWSGSFTSPDTYFVMVEHRGPRPSWFKLSIRSEGVLVPTARETAQKLQDEGYGVVDIGAALKALRQGATSAAQILKDVGFRAEETARALRDPDGYNIQHGREAAATLKDASFTSVETATALKTVYGALDPTYAARILKNVGFDVKEIARALRDLDVYNIQDAEAAAATLKDASFTSVETATALRRVYGENATTAARILKNVGFDVKETARALRDGYDMFRDPEAAATALKGASFTSVETATALRRVYGENATTAARILKNVGFDVRETALALRDPNAYNIRDAAAAATALKSASFTSVETASALWSVFEVKDATSAADDLKIAGYSAQETARGLKDSIPFAQHFMTASRALRVAGFSSTDTTAAVRAVYNESDIDTGLNGAHRRPFYIVAHNPNTLAEARDALAMGANALGPDVMRFSDEAYPLGQEGHIINNEADTSGLFMYHDHVRITTRMPETVEAYLDGLHNEVNNGKNLALIVFDIKKQAATADLGTKLREAVQTHLNYDGVKVNVIYSVGTLDDAAVFDAIIPLLEAHEGVMVDMQNDPLYVYNQLNARFSNASCGGCNPPHIAYGNGSIGMTGFGGTLPSLYPNVLISIDQASYLRAVGDARLAIPYAFPLPDLAYWIEFTNAGADGLMPDEDIEPQMWGATRGKLVEASIFVQGRSDLNLRGRPDLYLATAENNPWAWVYENEAYGLKVTTADIKNQIGEGTDSKLTFTLTGTGGSASVTIDSNFPKRMETGDTNYVTIYSKDLGTLQTLTITSDGSKPTTAAWNPGPIEIRSYRWGIQCNVNFTGVTVTKSSPGTKSLACNP